MRQMLEALRKRSDSYWELIATAAGDQESLAKTVNGLSSKELERGSAGLAISPSIVRERVEALSVWDARRLVDLTGTWKQPPEIQGDPFWTACWESSLRHVAASQSITRQVLDAPELQKEKALILPRGDAAPMSWADVTRSAEQKLVDSNLARKWAQYRLKDEVLNREDIEAAPPVLFRVLRSQTTRLDAGARDYILNRCKSLFSLDPYEAALIFEIGRRYDSELSGRLSNELLERLDLVRDPRDLIPLVYMFINEQWLVA